MDLQDLNHMANGVPVAQRLEAFYSGRLSGAQQAKRLSITEAERHFKNKVECIPPLAAAAAFPDDDHIHYKQHCGCLCRKRTSLALLDFQTRLVAQLVAIVKCRAPKVGLAAVAEMLLALEVEDQAGSGTVIFVYVQSGIGAYFRYPDKLSFEMLSKISAAHAAEVWLWT